VIVRGNRVRPTRLLLATGHETKVERLASRPFSLESPQTKHMRGQYDVRRVERERLRCDA